VRILIVDDEEVSLDVLRFSLEDAGHEVDAARDGDEALALLSDGRHHLVISDWEMPQTNGPELCREIRARDFGSYIYLILLTARNRAGSMVEGLAAGLGQAAATRSLAT